MVEFNHRRFLFFKSIPREQHRVIASQLVKDARGDAVLHYTEEGNVRRMRFLAEDEKDFLSSRVIPNAEEKLQDIGIENSKLLLPTPEQFFVVEYVNPTFGEEQAGGGMHFEGDFIGIEVGEGVRLLGSEIEKVECHEIAHFIAPIVIALYDRDQFKDYEAKAIGFDTFHDVKRVRMGMYNEPLADLFALFCLDRDDEMTVVYTLQVAFMVAFLKKMGELTGRGALGEFKRLFKANIERDFSIQKEVLELFGKHGRHVIRGINTVEVNGIYNDTDIDMVNLRRIAIRGNFGAEYMRLQKNILEGKPIQFPGMKGTMRSST